MHELLAGLPTDELLRRAAAVRDEGKGGLISYSRKVFIPLTQLCRDVCRYCTFAKNPSRLASPYLDPEAVLRIAQAGRDAGCTEALFTLGDKPELRHDVAARWLREHGYGNTVDYLVEMCRRVADETGLLPHVNAGVMDRADILRLRDVSASQGLMLESTSSRLCRPGGPHYGSPDKDPAVRLEMLRVLGECSVPTTTGLLIGIGETWQERLEALAAIKALHDRFGHVQEVIVQNFRPKPGTPMATVTAPSLDELLRTVAFARLILGADANVQVPPNLTAEDHERLLDAGINDWGGVSPVTVDHVNPEAPWPEVQTLERICERRGKLLVRRLPVYPMHALDTQRWLSPFMRARVLRAMDSAGWARDDNWTVGQAEGKPHPIPTGSPRPVSALGDIEARVREGAALSRERIARLFDARGAEFHEVVALADRLRREVCGDVVRYVVNRNINYTNLCLFGCSFCAFSKSGVRQLAGRPYDLTLEEIDRRTREAWDRGATEVCLQGGIHPDYTGQTYLDICRTVKQAAPAMHVHAFSPLEVTHGAMTLGLSIRAFLERLVDAGLGSLPGTAAEILTDAVRKRICPDKLDTKQWIDVIGTAHSVGLRTTSTMMFGSVESYDDWATHLLELRTLQMRTGGITEFVPLPFVAEEAPMYRKGLARRGPTFREAVLVHAVARIALHGLVPNIQVSWVKMGRPGVEACLGAGANDLGGTLMNESISRAAGAQHGQELPPASMREWIVRCGRSPRQRTTLYGPAPEERRRAAEVAKPLAPVVLSPARRRIRIVSKESTHV